MNYIVTVCTVCLYLYIGSVGSNEVIDFVTRVRNHYCEPRLIKHCENDEETILVTINDFLVQGIYWCVFMYNDVHIITYN